MKYLNFIILTICFISCDSNPKIIEGFLYFKLVNIVPQTGMSDKQILELEKDLQKPDNLGDEDSTSIKIKKYFKTLKKHNLLKLPSIKIKTKEGSIKNIFLSKQEYDKIKSYTLKELQNKNKKISLKLEIKELDDEIYFSDEIKEIQEVNGETPWGK